MEDKDVLLSRKEAAERLGVSLRTLDRLIEEGALPAKRIRRRRVLIKAADLDRYIEGAPPAQDKPQ